MMMVLPVGTGGYGSHKATEEEAEMMWNVWGMGIAGWLGMGLFWLLLIGIVVWGLTRMLPAGQATRASEQRAEQRETPQEVLDRRFAAGEIDSAEYRERRADLGAFSDKV